MSVHRTKEDADKQIAKTLTLIKTVISEKVLGVYLYGSYTQGGLQPHSDIDIFVLLSSPTNDAEKEKLIKSLLDISIEDPNDARRPVELTMATQPQLKPWTGAPDVDFQYGEWMRQDFEKGAISPWDNPHTDLAITVTQVLLSGKKLHGKEAAQVLDPVPTEDMKRIMVSEIEDLLPELQADTRNVLLTLVRIWNTLVTNEIHSKQDAATWAMNKIPYEFKPVLQHTLAVCVGEQEEDWSKFQATIRLFSQYLVSEINKLENTGT